MRTVELRSHLHELIDKIENSNLLQSLYDILLERKDSKPGALWKSLSIEQKKEVLKAYEESNDPENLIPHSEMKKKYK
ncbi:hypothetical protein E1176_05800 [Fulvivirga sp. RKSG066]|uniref:hypothetical protein n=1 Tax=Fulvivirga aurantia TaxID=2529383 RepID=UPI0012BC7C37|nr:hypothetical protein [Fulvivirga aurantia]MTI20527.1 hypothetical protein [Fulvivirga aurantia]